MRIPKPPLELNMKTLKDHLNDLHTLLETLLQNGSLANSLTQQQIDVMTSPEHFGKRLGNSDTGKQMISELNAGKTAVTWKEL